MSDTISSDTADQTKDSPSSFDFDEFISDAEAKISELKQRRATISDRQQDYDTAKGKVDKATLKDIELSAEIAEQLEKVEYELASELIGIVGEENLSWKTKGESFWVFFRYGGIGFLLAVIIHQFIN